MKEKVLHEFTLFWLYSAFFAFFFSAFHLYRSLILKEYDIQFVHYTYSIVEALILAKIILIGQTLHLAERFSNKSLIYPTFYKAIIFSLLTLAFTVGEHFLLGYIHGEKLSEVWQRLLSLDIYQILAKALVMFFVFLLFFAFLEIGRVLGEGKLYNLFLHRKKLDDHENKQ